MTPLFELGVVVATPGALDEVVPEQMLALLRRHASGDWGDVDGHDRRANNRALKDGLRLLSSYPVGTGGKVWIITEADRSATTILLPEEY